MEAALLSGLNILDATNLSVSICSRRRIASVLNVTNRREA